MTPRHAQIPDVAVPGPRIDYLREVVRWLNHWCRGRDTGIMDEPPVVIYVQHSEPPVVDRLDSSGEWRAEAEWPPPGCETAGALPDGEWRNWRKVRARTAPTPSSTTRRSASAAGCGRAA